VVPRRVCAQDVGVEVTAAHQDDVTILQDVTVSQPPQLHGRIITGTTDRTAPSHGLGALTAILAQGHESQE